MIISNGINNKKNKNNINIMINNEEDNWYWINSI